MATQDERAAQDLEVARRLERAIIGADRTALPCGCLVQMVCTMPVTNWVKVLARVTHCSGHPARNSLWDHDPINNRWADALGEPVHPERFMTAFAQIVEDALAPVMGTTELMGNESEQIASIEGKHYINKFGRTTPKADSREWHASFKNH